MLNQLGLWSFNLYELEQGIYVNVIGWTVRVANFIDKFAHFVSFFYDQNQESYFWNLDKWIEASMGKGV